MFTHSLKFKIDFLGLKKFGYSYLILKNWMVARSEL